MQHTPRLNRPSLLSMQHNYESQDGDGEPNGGIAQQAEFEGQQLQSLPVMRRVHSYSGAGAGVIGGRAITAERGSWDEGGRGNGFAFAPPVTVDGMDRQTVSALERSFRAGGVSTETTLPPRSISMHATPSFGSRPAESSGSASATGLLVGPNIPLALRRASSDQNPGAVDSGREEEAGHGKRKDRGFTGAAVQTGFSTGWTTPAVSTGKQPSTPPKGSATISSAAISTMSFNPGSPSNNPQGGSVVMSTTPVRSSAGLGLRARANSGTRLRSASGVFTQNQTRHPPLPPSLRATLAADKDLPSSEIRSEALLQRVIFSNPDSLPMTPKPSRRHQQQQQQQQYGQFGAAMGGTGTPGGALFGGNMNMFSGNGYAGRTAARPPRFLDSAASTIDSDDEDEMEDSSDEEAQFAVDDIMDVGGASIGNGTGPTSRSGSGSGSASGSLSLGLAGARASSNAGTEGGMEVDVPMASGSGAGQGKLSNRTSMTSLRGFAGIDTEDSGGSSQHKNMTTWRESPSSTSNRAQKRKAGHDDSRYEPYGKRHRGDGPLSPLQWTSALPGTSVPPIPISPSNQYTAHHPHFPPSLVAGGPSGSASSAGTGTGSEGAVMQMDVGSGLALNKYGYPSVAVATARSRAGSPVANTYAAMRTAVSPVASSPLSTMSGMGIGGASGAHPPAAYRPPSSSSAAGAGGTTIGMNGMGGLGMLLLSKRHATNPGGTGMGLVSMGDDSGEMEVAEGIHGMDVTEHGAESQTRDDEDDKMMFD
ncbi:hypothetical protein QFC21_002209 [Naganishia friedmannii]|uniref:Uncharacterized protein n=1 Tax=Naganishia friedmannii TaxID=89922 RepID=A0ACC2VWC3_9TREE|nr:hypothetical protein QFC21_002209 [Naganishia friedmannii]